MQVEVELEVGMKGSTSVSAQAMSKSFSVCCNQHLCKSEELVRRREFAHHTDAMRLEALKRESHR